MNFTFYKQPDSMDGGPTCMRIVGKRNVSLQHLGNMRQKRKIFKTFFDTNRSTFMY